MGTVFSISHDKYTSPATFPNLAEPAKFDPLVEGRKVREMKVSQDDMYRSGLEPWQMDFCAHKLIEWKECGRLHRPFASWYCQHENHAYQECEFHDTVGRLKEFERERRLLKRMQRKREAAELVSGPAELQS